MKIAIDDKCQEVFKQLKFEKAHRYLIYRIENERIVVDQTGDREQTWDQFLSKLPANEYRFCVFDLEFKTYDGMNTAKLFFCPWQPDGTKIKTKMLYATGKEAFKNHLGLNAKQINLNSVSDYTEESLIKEFNK